VTHDHTPLRTGEHRGGPPRTIGADFSRIDDGTIVATHAAGTSDLGGHMTRSIAGLMLILSLGAAARASAQETSPGPGKLEITAIPAGVVYFIKEDTAPSLGNYGVGGSLVYNFNRLIGVEAEGGVAIAVKDLQFGTFGSSVKAPNMLGYNANVVVSAPLQVVVPYATAGVGGLTMFEREELGLNDSATFFTSNVGGGVKWYAPGGRWGLRGDYRFFIAASKDDAPAFFGTSTRYANRVYGAVIINAIK
jgi:hypothetical protein